MLRIGDSENKRVIAAAVTLGWAILLAPSITEVPIKKNQPALRARPDAVTAVRPFLSEGPEGPAATARRDPVTAARVSAAYRKLPVSFEANHGQTDSQVRFLARGRGYSLFLTPKEAVLQLRIADFGSRNSPQRTQKPPRSPGDLASAFSASSAVDALNPQSEFRNPKSAVLRLKLVGANPSPQVTGLEELPGKSNYFLGNDPSQWRTNVSHYAKVRYEAVYPGVDLVYYGNQGQLEYDFVVATGADPSQIRMAVVGAEKLEVDAQGDLVLQAQGGEVRLRQPVVYQVVSGRRKPIAARYVLHNPIPHSAFRNPHSELRTPHSAVGRSEIRDPKSEIAEVSFEVAAYDRRRPLVIDPVLSYSTYLGDIGVSVLGIAVDSSGNAYLTGRTIPSNFPTVNPLQPAHGGFYDAFLTKLNGTGSSLIYSTYLGGSDSDHGLAVAVDFSGNAYVTGGTWSSNFPTANAFQASHAAGGSLDDAFVTKLNPSGSALLYSTYLGGTGDDSGGAIAVDPAGNAYLTGRTDSTNFPTANPLQSESGSSVCFKSTNEGSNWSPSGSGLTSPVNFLSVDSTTPSTLFAGNSSGDVFKSIDGGSSWNASGGRLTGSGVYTIAIDPRTPSTVYAGTGGGGVFKSTDGGSSWSAANTGLPSFTVNALAIDPTSPSTLYAGTGGGGVFKSTNGGSSWSPSNTGLTNAGINDLAIDPITPSTVYTATPIGVFKTTNGGSSWSASNSGLTNTNAAALGIDPRASSTLYLGTSTGVFKSTNEGGSWSTTTLSIYVSELVIDPRVPSTLYAGGYYSGVFKSADGGSSWNAVNNGLPSVGLFTLAVAPTNPSTVYAGYFMKSDAFVTKLNPVGSALIYSTYLGGADFDGGSSIAVDSSGNAYVTGETYSSNFPTASAFRPAGSGYVDAFVTKLNADGSALVYSTYLGGNDGDWGSSIAVDSSGNAYVTGQTQSSNFPTANPLQPANGGGSDAFLTKLNAEGSALLYSTYLGGRGADRGSSIALNGAGSAFLTGATTSSNFPTANALQPGFGGGTCGVRFTGPCADSFVTKLNPEGSALIYSTYLGGSSFDGGVGIAVDSSGNAYVVGSAYSANFPTTLGAWQTTGGDSGTDFVVKITETTAPCTYSISPTIQSYSANGGTGLVILIAPSGCAWTAVSNDAWITITSGSSGTAIGTVSFSVAANLASNSRTGAITIAGQTFTVLQSFSGCNYSLSPTSQSFPASGGSGSVAVTTSTGCNWTAASNVSWISITSGTTGNGNGTATYSLAANPSWSARSATLTIAGQAFTVTQAGRVVPGNFDQDGKSDIVVWRPSNGTWYVRPSSNPSTSFVQQWGASGDIPVPGDYDGDAKTDMAVWRPANSAWYVIRSSNPGTFIVQQWGASGDLPVPGDYDGDAKTDMAVWRPANSAWYVIRSSNPGSFIVQEWGASGDLPVPGDYDGDGKTDIAVWRPSNGAWYMMRSSNPNTLIVQQWGTAGDVPVPGDYDGDARTDIAVWRPSSGTWYVMRSSDPSSFIVQQWGANGDVPVPGDYDGDNKTDVAVWRPSSGNWFVIPSAAPSAPTATQWGAATDVPLNKPIGQ